MLQLSWIPVATSLFTLLVSSFPFTTSLIFFKKDNSSSFRKEIERKNSGKRKKWKSSLMKSSWGKISFSLKNQVGKKWKITFWNQRINHKRAIDKLKSQKGKNKILKTSLWIKKKVELSSKAKRKQLHSIWFLKMSINLWRKG